MAKASPSDPPPSNAGPPVSGGGTGYVIGALVLAALAAMLLYSRCSEEPAKKPVATAAPVASKPPPAPLPEFAPPPPPEKDAGAEPSASASAAAAPKTAPKSGRVSPSGGGGGACSRCGEGVPSSALKSAVASTANLARGCYNKALQQGGAEGTLMVSVTVGSTGTLCGANVSGNVGNSGLKQCVLSKFKGRSYPKPQEGCVVVNVPISFKVKQ